MNRRRFFKTTAMGAGATMIVQGTTLGCSSTNPGKPGKYSGPLVPKPPLGWNSFDSYGVYLHEQAALGNLQAMAQKLKPHGYEYFVIDGGWYGEFELMEGSLIPREKHAHRMNLNVYGLFQPSQTYFPNGFGEINRLAKELGIKTGIHLMRGIPREAVEKNLPIRNSRYRAADVADKNRTCTWNKQNYGVDPGKPGAQDWYNSVVEEAAGWGFEFIKYDDLTPYPDEIMLIAKAIENVNPGIVLSLSPGDGIYLPDLPYYQKANLLRTTGDIWDRQEDIDKSFDAWKKFQGKAKPGFWPDLDMIPFGQLQLMAPDLSATTKEVTQLAGHGTTRWSKFTPAQARTFITTRAMAASPLFMGGDLISLDDLSLSLITSPAMLACNQNGVCGFNTYEEGQIEAWLTPSNEQTGMGWIGIFNRSGQELEVNLSREDLGFMEFVTGYKLEPVKREIQLKGIWDGEEILWSTGLLSTSIPAGDVLFFEYQYL